MAFYLTATPFLVFDSTYVSLKKNSSKRINSVKVQRWGSTTNVEQHSLFHTGLMIFCNQVPYVN